MRAGAAAHCSLQCGAHVGGQRHGRGLPGTSAYAASQTQAQLCQHPVVLQPPCPAARPDGLALRRLQVIPGYGGALEEGLGGHGAEGRGRTGGGAWPGLLLERRRRMLHGAQRVAHRLAVWRG